MPQTTSIIIIVCAFIVVMYLLCGLGMVIEKYRENFKLKTDKNIISNPWKEIFLWPFIKNGG
jgi:hypothetical protein